MPAAEDFLLTHTRLIALLTLLTLIAASGMAASYIVAPDEELIRSADAIAVVTVQSGHSYFTADGRIETSYSVHVDRPLKGLVARESITLVQSGGSVGDLAMITSSDPPFLPGERALLLLNQVRSNVYTTASGELGKFSFVRDIQSRELLVRGATPGEIFGWNVYGERHVERARDAALFLDAIEAIVRGETPSEEYFLEPAHMVSIQDAVEIMSVPGNDYMTPILSGRGGKWSTNGFSMQGVGDQAAVADDGPAVSAARGAWNGDAGSSISISYSGTGGSGEYKQNDGKNLLFFDQPNSGPLANNVVGQATLWATDSTLVTNWSDTYLKSLDCDIILEVGLSGSIFEGVLAHEMGHCLGFRHSNQPFSGQTTSTTNALMNSTTTGGATLRGWDRDAANHVYGSGAPACTAPAITTQPQGASRTVGQAHSMSVVASGTTPLTYQWRLNGSPIAGATSSSYNTGALNTAGTFTYSVVVTNACGNATSSNAVVTVTGGTTCTPPGINQHPQSQTVTSGGSATLGVNAFGTQPLAFQWYRGNSGNTSQPIAGATNSLFSTGALTATTSYWVRIQNSCGAVNSTTATVTIQASCQAPAITAQPQSTTIAPGASTVLGVSATGTGLQYQWFRGASGVTSQPVAGATGPTLNTGALQTTTQFWVRVSNSCGSLNSAAATVTVQAACQPPAITVQPQSRTINYNTSATLVVGASGTAPLSIQWYRGFEGDPSNPIPGANALSFNTGSLTATTRYFAHVSNACGAVNTGTTTVTVKPPPRRRAVRRF